jgi:hypothetical protein
MNGVALLFKVEASCELVVNDTDCTVVGDRLFWPRRRQSLQQSSFGVDWP